MLVSFSHSENPQRFKKLKCAVLIKSKGILQIGDASLSIRGCSLGFECDSTLLSKHSYLLDRKGERWRDVYPPPPIDPITYND